MLNPRPLQSLTSSTILTSGDHRANSPSSSSSALTSTLRSTWKNKEGKCWSCHPFCSGKNSVSFQTGKSLWHAWLAFDLFKGGMHWVLTIKDQSFIKHSGIQNRRSFTHFSNGFIASVNTDLLYFNEFCHPIRSIKGKIGNLSKNVNFMQRRGKQMF